MLKPKKNKFDLNNFIKSKKIKREKRILNIKKYIYI